MKRLLYVIIVVIIFKNTSLSQQSATVDNKSVIETQNGGILLFNNFNELDLYFYVDLENTTVKTTERNNLFDVGGKPLQILALDKNKYVGNTDAEILQNHAKSETEYIGQYLKSDLTYKTESIEIKTGNEALFWSYEMPEEVSKEVKNQLYVTFIYKDFIIGANTAQFENQKFSEIKTFLVDVCKSTHFSNVRITLEYLCEKREN